MGALDFPPALAGEGRVGAYGIGGGEGRGGAEGRAGSLSATGGTDGSDLSSWPIVLVAEFRVAVEPGSTESGTLAVAVPPCCPANSLPPWGGGLGWGLVETAAGAAEDEVACGIGLEAFMDTTISGTAASAARR
jgi:hypothetical protein